MKLDKVLNFILVFLAISVVGLGAYCFMSVSKSSISESATTSSVKTQQTKRAKSSSQRKNAVASKNTEPQSQLTNKERYVRYDNVGAAETAIQEHEASCPYDHQPFYPGKVYTGEYVCNCGLHISWWDKAVKASVDRDMKRLTGGGNNSDNEYEYGTDDPETNASYANQPAPN